MYATERGYVRGDNVSRLSPSPFQGVAFKQTPARPFGWVISGGSCPVRTPDGERDESAPCLTRYEIIQVYDQRHVDDITWYLIGPNRWLPKESLSIVDPDPSRPEGVESDRWISVNLEQQNVAGYDSGELVYATLSSTGRDGTWTQPGAFQVWARLERDDMSGGVDEGYYALDDVPWVLYFDQARALHGTYWHDRFGTPQSRGCVNLSIADARWFFNFAQEGSWVYVWDPSGETPTDPTLYTAGGA
ncbi:MAG: L,D-transpeptidase [Anaerolineales bacterium]|nr:L,D-transpeptidase [Anaerolineales bacterium]